MANEVAKTSATSGALAAANALKKNLKKVSAALPETRGAGFMSFGKDGIWTFGKDSEEVFDDDKIAVNPLSIETGFICWSDRGDGGPKNEVLGEVMVPLGGDVPLAHTLPQKTDEKSVKTPVWKDQISVQMRFLDGPHKGTQVKYSTTSLGGIEALRGLVDQIMLQLDEDPEQIVPVLSLGSDSYTHKKWGKTYTPVVKITDFMALEDAPAEEPADKPAGEPEAEPEAPKEDKAPAARSRGRARPKPEDVEDADVIEGTATEEAAGEKPKASGARTRTRRR